MNSIQELQNLVLSEFTDWKQLGEVSASYKEDLVLFNYTPKAQYEGRWNYFEQISRGLILNTKTGEIVARPFDKFFNWGEGGRYSTGKISTITEKIDGSLGILYFSHGWKIATRGSFTSQQALFATDFLNRNYDLVDIPKSLTLLFEIVYPDNRVVVNYGDKKDLILLAGRWTKTGEYISFEQVMNLASVHNFSLPKVYQFNDCAEIIEATKSLDPNSEGWVVEFDDGPRFKFKGEEYKKLHRLISGLSFKNTLECVASGTLEELTAIIPDEFMTEVSGWIDQIQSIVEETKDKVELAYSQAPKSTRKEFALWALENYKSLSPYLFARLDGKPVEPLIYKMAFEVKE